ncbi:histidine kinase [Streptomyces sp. NPDC001700]
MGKTVRQAGRATRHLAVAMGQTFASYLFITVLLMAVAASLTMVGAGVLPEAVLLVRRIAGAKRRRTASWTGRDIPEAYVPVTGALRERLSAVLHDPGTYRDLRWLIAQYCYGWLLPLPIVVLWPVGLVVDGVWSGVLGRRSVVLPLISRLADLDAAWSATLLRPAPKALLAARVRQLATTRAEAVEAHGSELRRIERDLHDGAQARLVALSMRIGLARRAYEHDPAAGRRLLDEAQDQAEEALTELRQVVRGIHPPILTDRGLAGAVRALAAGSGIDVAVHIDGLADGSPRAPAAVEAAAYFVVAEALTNAAKHSGGDHAEVRLARTRHGLHVSVRDNGRGGIEDAPAGPAASRGSGVTGMRRRVAAIDGTFALTSPAGGPTVIEVDLPCAW